MIMTLISLLRWSNASEPSELFSLAGSHACELTHKPKTPPPPPAQPPCQSHALCSSLADTRLILVSFWLLRVCLSESQSFGDNWRGHRRIPSPRIRGCWCHIDYSLPVGLSYSFWLKLSPGIGAVTEFCEQRQDSGTDPLTHEYVLHPNQREKHLDRLARAKYHTRKTFCFWHFWHVLVRMEMYQKNTDVYIEVYCVFVVF